MSQLSLLRPLMIRFKVCLVTIPLRRSAAGLLFFRTTPEAGWKYGYALSSAIFQKLSVKDISSEILSLLGKGDRNSLEALGLQHLQYAQATAHAHSEIHLQG